MVAGLEELELQLGVAWLGEAEVEGNMEEVVPELEVEGNMEEVVLALVGHKWDWVFQVDKDLQ